MMLPAALLALARRLRDHAAMHDTVIPHDGDQQQWKLVPVTPTPEMLAAVSWPGCAATDYAHMLAAAPQPPSAQPTLTAEIVEAGTPNMFWDENPDGEGYVGNTLQEIVEIACDDLTAADGHLYVDVGCARKLPTIAVRAWIDGEGALQWEEVPDAWPWGDE